MLLPTLYKPRRAESSALVRFRQHYEKDGMHYKLTFVLLLSLASSLCLSAQSDFLAETTEKWDNATAYTVELAESMPAEYYTYRPTAEQMSFQQQLLHIASNISWLTHTYLGGDRLEIDREMTGATKAEVIVVLETAMANAKAALSVLPAEQLDQEVAFFAGPMSKRKVILLLHDHLTHHRGQLIVYARLKGVKPPKYRGW